ncbi:unnamed protein product, partial [Ascophyllum nodosum]
AITCGAENARSQLWINSLFYGTTIVVYGHQRHHLTESLLLSHGGAESLARGHGIVSVIRK